MSLDVHLSRPAEPTICYHCDGIGKVGFTEEVFSANITHNLGTMADEAGIYKHLWSPEELSITKAGQLVGPLRDGLELMKSDPARFEKFNAPNGWGRYEQFVSWIERYLEACRSNPDADVYASR